MSGVEFRDFFLRVGVGGADSYRATLGGVIGGLGDLMESVDAPYSGLDAAELERQLAAELRDLDRGAEDAYKKCVDLVAANSIIVQHPLCAAHLHTPPLVSSLAAEAVISALNQSMDSWDQASAATHVEMQMVDWFARRYRLPDGADGTFTAGATQSNFIGLLLARDEVCKRVSGHVVFDDGLPDYASRLRVVCSEKTHFSIVKSLAQLGLGARAVATVACDAHGAMKAEALEATLSQLVKEGLIPMAVVATVGTTDNGAVDPLAEMADICGNHGVWFHVDAAYGGALMLTKQRARLDGIGKADSLALDFHKFFYQPISCGLLLLGDGAHFHHLEHHADYLNREADPRPNLVEKTVATSRRFDALKIWLTLKAVGAERLGEMFDHVIDLAQYAKARVVADKSLELMAEPQLSSVLFRYLPADAERADEVNIQLHEELISSGRAIVGRTTLDGAVILKFTLLNPCLSEGDLDTLVAIISDEGSKIETATS